MRRTISFFCALVLCLGLAACAGGGEKTPTWQEQYDLGVRYLGEGNYQEAVIAFTAAIEIDPQRADAYLGLADAYMGLGDEDAARQAIADAIAACGEQEALTDWLSAHPEDTPETPEAPDEPDTPAEPAAPEEPLGPPVPEFTPEQTALLQSLSDSLAAQDADTARSLLGGEELRDLMLSLDPLKEDLQGPRFNGLDFGDMPDGTGMSLLYSEGNYVEAYYGTWSGGLLEGPGVLCWLDLEANSNMFTITEATWSGGLTNGPVVRNEYNSLGLFVTTGTAVNGLWDGRVQELHGDGGREGLFDNGTPVPLGTDDWEDGNGPFNCYGRILETGELDISGPDAWCNHGEEVMVYAIPELGHFVPVPEGELANTYRNLWLRVNGTD